MGFLGATIKDAISNVVAFILVVVAVFQSYFATIGDQPINWYTLAMLILGAVISYLTGKGSNAKPKVIAK